MLSRAANAIYWMGRYLERADNVARFINVNSSLIIDMEQEINQAQWEPLILASGDQEDFNSRYSQYNEKNVLSFLTFDNKNPNSIISCIQYARENARTVQEIISSEMWETINALFHITETCNRRKNINNLQCLFDDIHKANNMLVGVVENTMPHDEAWHFLRLGRMIERADKTARILDVKYFLLLPSVDYINSSYDAIQWGALLKSVGGFEIYRKYFHQANYKGSTQFLILNPQFPRSIKFCIDTALDSLNSIIKILKIKTSANKEMLELKRTIDMIKIDDILNNGLHEFIDIFQFNINVVDQSLDNCFFSFGAL